MRRTALVLMLALASCVPAPTRVAGFRPPSAGLWSVAAFAPARIEGQWRQAAAFATTPTPGCRAGGATFTRQGNTLSLVARLCLDGREVSVAGPVRVAGPGRLTVPGMKDWWVIWVDSGYRTLAVGTPDGSFGFVLDRETIPPDRLTAAAEIFAFNGYAPARLKPF